MPGGHLAATTAFSSPVRSRGVRSAPRRDGGARRVHRAGPDERLRARAHPRAFHARAQAHPRRSSAHRGARMMNSHAHMLSRPELNRMHACSTARALRHAPRAHCARGIACVCALAEAANGDSEMKLSIDNRQAHDHRRRHLGRRAHRRHGTGAPGPARPPAPPRRSRARCRLMRAIRGCCTPPAAAARPPHRPRAPDRRPDSRPVCIGRLWAGGGALARPWRQRAGVRGQASLFVACAADFISPRGSGRGRPPRARVREIELR